MSSLEVAKESARGSVILVVGSLLSTFVSAAATIIVARLLGPDGYGMFTLALVGPSIFWQFFGLGVNLAVTRYAAFHLSKGEVGRAVEITKRGTVFLVLLGALLAVANYLAAPYISTVVLKRATLTPYMEISSIFIIGQAATQAASAAFVGWGMMKEVSIFAIVQSTMKLLVSPVLILIGFGVYGAVIGHVVSYLVAGGSAVLTLFALRLKAASKGEVGFLGDIRAMIIYGLPAFAGGIIAGLASQYITVLLAEVATTAVVGYYQAAINVTVAISVVSTGPTTVLFRSFAALDGLKADISLALDYAVRYVSFMLTPVVFFLLASAGLMFGVIYGPFYSGGVILLQLVAISYLPMAFGYPVWGSFLNGTGNSRLTLLVSIAGAVALVAASSVLAVGLGMGAEGIVYGLLVGNTTVTALGAVLSIKYLHIKLRVSPLFRIVVAALASAIVVESVPHSAASQSALLVIDMVIFALVYLTCVPLFRGIRIDDVERLRASMEGAPIIGQIIDLILRYERWILLRSGAQ